MTHVVEVGEATRLPDGRGVKSAERTLRILELLGAARGPVSVVALHRETGYPRASLHQLLHTMAAMQWMPQPSRQTRRRPPRSQARPLRRRPRIRAPTRALLRASTPGPNPAPKDPMGHPISLGIRDAGIAKERPRSRPYYARSSGLMSGRLNGDPRNGNELDP